jgi:hypothetical protein
VFFFVGRSQEEGKKQREDEEGRSRDSPLPLHCSLEDLLLLIEAGQDMRKITKVIKMLCNSEDALRCVLLFFYLFFFFLRCSDFEEKSSPRLHCEPTRLSSESESLQLPPFHFNADLDDRWASGS